MPFRVQISPQAINPWEIVSQYQEKELPAGKYGALSLFVGTMRDFSLGNQIHSLHIEHYPEMTNKYLANTVSQMYEQYDVMNILVVHRIGTIKPNEPIVIIGVWGQHRKDALEVNHLLVEALKTTIPLWKKEFSSNGQKWVKMTA